MGRKRNGDTLNPEIRKIRLNELENFLNSREFHCLPVVPITPSRTQSYLNNPHGKPDDVVLILALRNDELIAFRTMFAGVVTENNEVRFGWCSGNWVHPEFRRKGLSQLLLNEAYKNWNGRLMFTNYAPESEKLYLKTGWFKPVHEFNGSRGYLFPKTLKLLPFARKNPVTKTIFSMADLTIRGISKVRTLFYNYKGNPEITFEETRVPDEACFQFIQNNPKKYLFKWGRKEWDWIFKFPWISEKNRDFKNRYPFSACSGSFYYRTVKINAASGIAGFFVFSVREGHLKTLYFHIPSDFEDEVACFLRHYCIKHQIEVITVYHSGIAGQLTRKKFPFLHIKKAGQKIYSTFQIDGNSFHFRDGEGDYVFT
jgi:GNAT superfamily N-acetyltransferase